MKLFVVLSCALLASPALAQATNPALPADPLAIDTLLPAIVSDLKRTLPDAYSIRDLIVCPPSKVKYEVGRATSWTVQLAFNSRNENGGYGGLASYAIGFKEGRVKLHVFRTSLAGKGGFDGLINNTILKRMASCTAIPDGQLQDLLKSVSALGG